MSFLGPRRWMSAIYALNLLVFMMLGKTLGATAAPLDWTGGAVGVATHLEQGTQTSTGAPLDAVLDPHDIKQAFLASQAWPSHELPSKAVPAGLDPESPGLHNYDSSELLFPADLDFDRGRQVEFALSPDEHYASAEVVKRWLASKASSDGTLAVLAFINRPRDDATSLENTHGDATAVEV